MISWCPCQMKSQSIDEMQTTSGFRSMRKVNCATRSGLRPRPRERVSWQRLGYRASEDLIPFGAAEMHIVGEDRRGHARVDRPGVEKPDAVFTREICERRRAVVVQRAHHRL